MRKLIILAGLLLSTASYAQHAHRPQDLPLHHKFYKTWMMPDNPSVSCCDDNDCQPAAAKFEDGDWWGRWEGRSEWVRIPKHKVEYSRDTPDGRAHMCGFYSGKDFYVYCFVTGSGS